MSVVSTRITIDGPAGALEAMLEHPTAVDPATMAPGTADQVPAVAVVCHPHPQFQGTMLNKVVHTLARSAIDCGLPALRFNYRGVGKSEGVYDNGLGETDDAEAVVGEAQRLFGTVPLVLMGFSFGAGVALRVAQRVSPAALVAAAPPVGRLGVPEQVGMSVPWQVVQGTADELVDSTAVERWAATQTPPPELVMMDGVSHFFHGSLTTMRKDVRAFLIRSLELPDSKDASD